MVGHNLQRGATSKFLVGGYELSTVIWVLSVWEVHIISHVLWIQMNCAKEWSPGCHAFGKVIGLYIVTSWESAHK